MIHVIKERSKVILEIPKIITPPYQYDYTTRQDAIQPLNQESFVRTPELFIYN